MDNIFASHSACAQCVRAIYSLLNEKEWVSTNDVWDKLGYANMRSKQQLTYDKAIKKAKRLICDELHSRGLDLRKKIDDKDRRVNYISWQEGISNPLQDLVRAANVRAGLEAHKALQIRYSPGYREPEEHIFHPQYARIYNNREFIFGEYEGEHPDWKYVVLPMDRIVSAEIRKDIPYRHRDEEYYLDALKNVVGVSVNPSDTTIYTVVIKTLDVKIHGLIKTKPIHWSQKEIHPCTSSESPGEIRIQVQLNNELRATLLRYGDAIEVVSPEPLREQMQKVSNHLFMQYNLKK